MKRISYIFTVILLIALLGNTSCELPASLRIEPTPENTVVTVGFTTSLTGKYVDQSTEQTNGILLWIKTVNEAGGLRLATGEMVTLASKSYDDQSDGNITADMYTKLIMEDNVDYLFGPYSSELTDNAAPIANENGKILISAGAAADSTFQNNYASVYQIYSPGSKYLRPALEILDAVDPNSKRIAILIEDDPFAASTITAIIPSLQILGYQVVYREEYPVGTTDFETWIAKLAESHPNIIFAGGHNIDGRLLTLEMQNQGVDARMIVLLVSPAEEDFSMLGNASYGIMGPSQWEAGVFYSEEIILDPQSTWFGPSGAEFVMDYKNEYDQEPSYFSAGGYAAGLVLQYAIETSGSLRTAYLLPIIDAANLSTFFGNLKFDPQGSNHGLQIGHEVIYVQWQYDINGELIKRVVWPIDLATSPLIYPLP